MDNLSSLAQQHLAQCELERHLPWLLEHGTIQEGDRVRACIQERDNELVLDVNVMRTILVTPRYINIKLVVGWTGSNT